VSAKGFHLLNRKMAKAFLVFGGDDDVGWRRHVTRASGFYKGEIKVAQED
jgi:hypothetical protein